MDILLQIIVPTLVLVALIVALLRRARTIPPDHPDGLGSLDNEQRGQNPLAGGTPVERGDNGVADITGEDADEELPHKSGHDTAEAVAGLIVAEVWQGFGRHPAVPAAYALGSLNAAYRAAHHFDLRSAA